MFGYFLLSTEIYIIIQILFLLFCGVILQEKLLYLKYKFNVMYFMLIFSCFILFNSLRILYDEMYYEAILLNYQLVADNITFFFKFIVLFASILCIIVSYNYCKFEKIKVYEYVLILLVSIVGLLTIISSYDLMSMYLGIELQSLCFYIITNVKFYSNFSIEAGLKYFILGALSSGIILFGTSLLYGFTGLTNFLDLTILFYNNNFKDYNLYYYESALIGLIFIYCGILFKIGIVPFHMWVSDIYEGSPTNITFFFAIVPQISIIALMLRLNIVFVFTFLKDLYIFFLMLAGLSIVVGTFGAIYQTKLKRILAYSGISNMGYILSILLTVNIESMYSVIFYIIVYNTISIGLWILLLSFRNQSNLMKFKDINDVILLFKSNKNLSIIFILFLFSAMGIPPMLGFFSKLFVLLNVIELQMNFFALFLIILNSVGVIYYLRFIKIMFSSSFDKFLFLVDIKFIKVCFLIFLVYLNIFFFFYPSHLLMLIHNLVLFLF